jgi:hypothetical protein
LKLEPTSAENWQPTARILTHSKQPSLSSPQQSCEAGGNANPNRGDCRSDECQVDDGEDEDEENEVGHTVFFSDRLIALRKAFPCGAYTAEQVMKMMKANIFASSFDQYVNSMIDPVRLFSSHRILFLICVPSEWKL